MGSLITFLGSSVNGPRQFRVRLGRLGNDDDVGSVPSGSQSYGLPDPTARPSDEQSTPS